MSGVDKNSLQQTIDFYVLAYINIQKYENVFFIYTPQKYSSIHLQFHQECNNFLQRLQLMA